MLFPDEPALQYFFIFVFNHIRFMLKKILPLLIFFAGFFFATTHGYAQPNKPMGPACWPPPCSIPLDGGISLLIAAGVALGGKKFHDIRKKK